MCPRSLTWTSIWGEKKQNDTRCSPPSLCSHHPSLCVCGRVSDEKQCCPTGTEHYSRGGSKRAPWKEEGWVVFRPVWLFSFKQCVGRHSEAHRHAIPSPTDIILHQSQRGNADGWGGRGEGDWTEELFRLGGGGIKIEGSVVKDLRAHLPLA